MTSDLAAYLGKAVSALLEASPFNTWAVQRSVEDDLPEPIIHHVFPGCGLELRCDHHEMTSVIFVDAETWAEDAVAGIPFVAGRSEVMAKLGVPSKSGVGLRDPILGEYGAWDRFSRAGHAIHIEYRVDVDRIRKVTWMREDVVP